MNTVGQREKKTQQRVVKLFRDTLGYRYLGNWEEREGVDGKGNRNIEPELLRVWLKQQGHPDALIGKVLHELEKAAGDTSRSLYDRNRAVYEMLRYGVKVRPDLGENAVTVWLVDWQHPERNDFAIAEEVTVPAAGATAHGKRPDVVLYVNGIALAVLELKRSIVSVAEGIRQNLDNQKKEFIQPFFSTMQLVMAGNDTEGLRYGTIETKEKYYLTWKEAPAPDPSLDAALAHLCGKERFLDLLHNFVLFDAGTKKLCRHNQFFAVHASQPFVQRREGGIIWNTQGSGKSLIMVWLAKWIREHVPDPRVLIVTDRKELDEQIEKVFKGVNEDIYRTRSGADLIARLNATKPWLLCSLIHKFGGKQEGDEDGDAEEFIQEMKQALPPGFRAKGNLFVFVDECHRTQSGDLHDAMTELLPGAVFIGFTGTPLLQADKKRSIEVFGRYIHTYKFDEAVKDGVVLDLRYEARDIDQNITSQAKIDQWFEAKTRGLTDLAKAQLKSRWGTMQKVLSCRSRLEKITADIMLDMGTRDRLVSGRGNALLMLREHLRGVPVLRPVQQDRPQGQVRHRHVLRSEHRRHQRRGKRRRRHGQRHEIPDLPPNAGGLVQRTAGHGGQPGGGVREGGEEEVHRGAGPTETAHRGGQTAHRLRRAAGDLSLHRQADAGSRPVPGHLPRESSRRRRQGIRLHH
jgi:type I restriction enzyme R subunit